MKTKTALFECTNCGQNLGPKCQSHLNNNADGGQDLTCKPQHTPTPWHRNVSPAWKYPIYADKNGNPDGRDWIHIGAVLSGNPNAEADLDFIIRAVNAHEELLDACKYVLKHWDNPGIAKQIVLKKAIAKAEAK